MAIQAVVRRPVAMPDNQDFIPRNLVCRWRKDETGRLVCAWQKDLRRPRDQDDPQWRGRIVRLAGARKEVRHVGV